ncbi:chymase-like [Oncorhynchus nerka]|uniref:chymase-like n=1 Tax=Oncorhynchus nerka TaxID=8023 RepID=UPI0031B80534
MVVVGAHDISRQESSACKIDVKYYHIHPDYNSETFQNDIMLLQVHDSGRMHTCQNRNDLICRVTVFNQVLQGDSDGPLVCKGTAVRVVSFNEKGNCDNPKEPKVYTKVAKYLSWIKCIIKY